MAGVLRISRSNALRGVVAASLAVVACALVSCDDKSAAGVESVKIKGHWFHLELVDDPQSRFLGLGGREFIEEDGGMLFAFNRAVPLDFVMRDCPIAIDVAFLDGAGRVLAVHAMAPEPPRGPEEKEIAYDSRLPRYGSRFPATFAIETRGGRMAQIGLEQGDLIKHDWARLKRGAK